MKTMNLTKIAIGINLAHKMKSIPRLFLLGALAVMSIPAQAQMVFDDFESYTAGNQTVSAGGWVGNTSSYITPDAGSGYTFVMQGTRSAWFSVDGSAQLKKPFSASSVTWGASDVVKFSTLVTRPDGLSSSNFFQWILSPTNSGTTGAGMFVLNNGTNTNIWLDGDGTSDTGVSFSSGGGGAPTLNFVYRFSMVVDWSTLTFEGLYEDVSNDPGNEISLGSWNMQAFGGGLDTATSYLNLGYIGFYTSSGVTGIDEITVTVIPEPGSIALVGAGVLALVFAKGRRRRA